MQYMSRIATFAVALHLLCSTGHSVDLDDLSKALEKMPTTDSVLEFKNTTHEYVYPNGKETLHSRHNLHVWLDIKSGKVKAKFDPYIVAWESSKTGYLERYCTINYNGKYWVESISNSGEAGDASEKNRAEITTDRPWKLSESSTLEGFLPQSMKVYGDLNWSQFMSEPFRKASMSFEKTKDGKDLFKYQDIHTSVEITGNFSAPLTVTEHKYSANLSSPPDGQIVITKKMGDFMEFGALGKMPQKMERTYVKGGKLKSKEIVEIEFIGLHPHDEKIFEVNVPEGWRVEDTRFDISFKVGEDLDPHLLQLQSSDLFPKTKKESK